MPPVDSERGARSQAIRDYLAMNPEATASQIIPALKEQGIEVSQGLVANVKSTIKKKAGRTGKQKRGVNRPKTAAAPRQPAASTTSGLSAQDLIEANQLVSKLGGLRQTRSALDLLEKLAK
jgi:hypothetical protein